MNKTTAAIAVAAFLFASAASAQEVNSGSASTSQAVTQSASTSLSGGSAITSVGTSNTNTTAGNAFSATINVNQPADSGSGTLQPQSAGELGSSSNPIHNKTEVKTVGNPAAMSLATSFSQYNCANTAGAGAGWMGGVFSIGGAIESGPCNARANAAALVSLASVLPAEDPMKRQLVDAAIRLIGESTMATSAALKASQVSFFIQQNSKAPDNPGIVPPGYVLQSPPAVNQPGVYIGSDSLVMSRMGMSSPAAAKQ